MEYAGQGQALWTQLEAAMDQAAYINSEEHLFDLPKSEWPTIAQLQKELQPYLDLWVCSDFISSGYWCSWLAKVLGYTCLSSRI